MQLDKIEDLYITYQKLVAYKHICRPAEKKTVDKNIYKLSEILLPYVDNIAQRYLMKSESKRTLKI